MDAPVLGANDIGSCASSKWEMSVTWRHQRSHRHYVGDDYQVERAHEKSQVINRVDQWEIGVRRRFGPQWSLSVSLPVFNASRSSPIRNAAREVVDRSVSYAGDIGDLTAVARYWVWDPSEGRKSNLQFGFGLKLPTGPYGLWDQRTRIVSGEYVTTYETVDQSIQPGDGGIGLILDMQYVHAFRKDRAVATYVAWSYLFNPRGTNGTPTFRSAANEQVMSVADQYLIRSGVSFQPVKWRGFSTSLGMRWEGVAVRDLIGPDDGFRRPGYGIAIEPGFAYTRGKNTFAFNVPIALWRERQRSVPDLEVPGRHGDAAFADFVLTGGWWHRF